MTEYLSNPYVTFVIAVLAIVGLYVSVKNFYKVDRWLYTFKGTNAYKNQLLKGDIIIFPGLLYGFIFGLFTLLSSFTQSNPEPAILIVGILSLVIALVLAVDCFRCFGLAAGSIRFTILLTLNGAILVISLIASVFIVMAMFLGVSLRILRFRALFN